jgi:hypothetical protein
MTNAEIAQALFVTVRTVEHHLTHAYQAGDHLPGVARTRSGRNWHQQAPFSSLSRPSLGGSVPAAGTSQTRPARRRRVKAGISDLGRSAASA